MRSKKTMRGIKKQAWVEEEDTILEILTRNQPVRGIKWMKIASKHRILMEEKMVSPPLRSPKQCRERWNIFIRPDLKRGSWTETEDLQLIDLHRKFGKKYSSIAKALQRTDVHVRNRIHSTQRMVTRYIEIGREKSNSVRKNGPLFKYFLGLHDQTNMNIKQEIDQTNNIKQEKIDDDVKANAIIEGVMGLHDETNMNIKQEIDDDVLIENFIDTVMAETVPTLPLPLMQTTPQHQITDLRLDLLQPSSLSLNSKAEEFGWLPELPFFGSETSCSVDFLNYDLTSNTHNPFDLLIV